MWDALDIGSAPIQVLEPGCGTGNFMAGIPENIKANVSGVELDPISARIAAALNPDATILNADLADCTIHPGFDLTIGNVPYSGDISLDYRTTDGGTSRLPLHDYFIERSVDAERELAAAQETLAEPFAHEDEYRQKQAELERLTSKPDEPRETESRDQETKERSAGMPLTTENARRLLEQDHDVTEVTQGGNAMGHYLEARLTDGRAVQIDFHDNPAWKDTDRLAGRIEVSYANRPQAEWQYDDNDMADREHTVIDPADPAAGKTLAKAVEGWERAGGLHTARAAGTSHLAANQPPEEYAYRWRKPGDPDRHIAYLSTAFDPENDIATYLAYPSDKAVQIAGDGLTSADIAEKREMGGWDPRKDPLMRINAQGDWTGITQQQADQIVWDNRDEILTRASYDSELSTWTLHQLDQLKEPQPAQSLDRDRPEPDHKAPAQADSTTKRHGPRL